MPSSSKSSGSTSPPSPTPALDPPPPVQEFDDIYVEEVVLDGPAMPEDTVYDRKGKGKARQRSQSRRTPRLGLATKDCDLDSVVAAKQAYLSPPLTASDSFLLGVHNISLALRKGFSSIDFDVDLDLQSGSERSSSPDGHHSSSSSTASGRDEEGFEVGADVVGTAVSEISLEEEKVDESSILTPSAPSEAESSRKATVGDTTLQDAGSVLPAVRFPSIFMDDSSLESSRVGSPFSPLLALSGPVVFDDLEHPRRRDEVEGPITKDSGGGILIHRRQSTVEVGVKSKRKRIVLRERRLKIQEKGLTRDFLLIITLCFGMACAGILIVRPSLMALYGYDTLGGRLDLDFD